MVDIGAALANISSVGIVGIVLIFAPIPLLLSASSWLIIRYTKPKRESAKEKTSTLANKELQT